MRHKGRRKTELIEEVNEKIQGKSSADIFDWVLALMRRGFTKDEAKALFFRQGFSVDSKGNILKPEAKTTSKTSTWSPRAAAFGSTKSDDRQQAIDKTLAEMEARAERMRVKALGNHSLPSSSKVCSSPESRKSLEAPSSADEVDLLEAGLQSIKALSEFPRKYYG